jgi:hypothetical protein
MRGGGSLVTLDRHAKFQELDELTRRIEPIEERLADDPRTRQ